MITTARDIIKRSLRLISATASGEDPTAYEFTDCLNALTTLAEAWDIEKLMASVDLVKQHSLASGLSSFSIGPTGDFVAASIPTFLNYVYISSATVNYEATIPDTRKEFDDEVQSFPEGWPAMAYYTKHDPASDESVLSFSCAFPETAVVSFGISGRGPAFSTLDAPVDLPAGLKRAIEYNLAVEVAPEFQAQVSQTVMQTANESKATFKLHNLTVDKLRLPGEIAVMGHDTFDVRTGE